MTAKRILVVDDEAAIREVLALCLRKLGGWQVSLAASGREALEKVHQDKPDAIVLDGMMPEMDGLTLLHHLQADPVTQPIPIILFTGNPYLFAGSNLRELGVVLAIAKPFSSEDLVKRIARALNSPP